MKSRITNTTHAPLDAAEAKKLLRNKYMQTEAYAPGLNLLEVLLAAYPQAQRPTSADGCTGGTDWQALAWAMAIDFVPAFQPGGAPGRPVAKKDGLVAAVEDLLRTKVARSVVLACKIIERRKLFPEITDVRKAYYRRRKKLSR
jgi:hypothetical protein